MPTTSPSRRRVGKGPSARCWRAWRTEASLPRTWRTSTLTGPPRRRGALTTGTARARTAAADPMLLFDTSDLLGLGLLADASNRRPNADRVFFSANQHI